MDDVTWARAKRDLLRHHPLGRDVGGEVRFVLVFDGTRVGVRARPLASGDLEVLAEVARLDSFEPAEALRWNAELATGALAIVGDIYVVRCVFDDLDGEHLAPRIQAVAIGAARLKRLTHPVVDPACCGIAFANYAE